MFRVSFQCLGMPSLNFIFLNTIPMYGSFSIYEQPKWERIVASTQVGFRVSIWVRIRIRVWIRVRVRVRLGLYFGCSYIEKGPYFLFTDVLLLLKESTCQKIAYSCLYLSWRRYGILPFETVWTRLFVRNFVLGVTWYPLGTECEKGQLQPNPEKNPVPAKRDPGSLNRDPG